MMLTALIPLTLLLLSSTSGQIYPASSDVAELNDETFKEFVLSRDGVVLAEFYAPWCGHCKALTNDYNKVAKALKGVADVVAIDATANEKIAKKYQIEGFPTLKIFGENKRSPIDYNGERSADAMVSAVLKETGNVVNGRLGGRKKPEKKTSSNSRNSGTGNSRPTSSSGGGVFDLTDNDFDSSVTESGDLWLVAFIAPWCGHCKKLEPEFEAAAGELEGIDVKLGRVDATANEALAQRFQVKGYPTIKVFKPNGDESVPEDYQGPRETAGIVTYMSSIAGPPRVLEVTDQKLFDSKCGGDARICLVAFFSHILDTSAADRNNEIARLQNVAKDLMGARVTVLWVEQGAQQSLQDELLGSSWSSFPAAAVLSVSKEVAAPYRGSWTESNLKRFASPATKYDGLSPIVRNKIEIEKKEPWDGKDAVVEYEEEFSLEDLMGDDEL